MESATILTSPSTSLSGVLLSSEPNIPEGPEYEIISTLSMHGENFYQLHTETTTAVRPPNNVEKWILQK